MSFRQHKFSVGFDKNSMVENHFKMENLAGTKWHGGGRTGINSVLDNEIIASHLDTKKRNMGKGYLKLRLQNGDKNTPINIGGRMMYPNSEGDYVIIDGSVVDEMQKSEVEKREYLESIIEKAALSNNICALILGCADEAALKNILGKGANGGIATMDNDLTAVDAMPETIETYDPTGQTYSRAIQKLKLVMKNRVPCIDQMTPANTMNQEK